MSSSTHAPMNATNIERSPKSPIPSSPARLNSHPPIKPPMIPMTIVNRQPASGAPRGHEPRECAGHEPDDDPPEDAHRGER